MDSLPLLTIVTFLPLVGGLLLFAVPKGAEGAVRWVALATAVLGFVVSLPLLGYDGVAAGMQFAENYAWIPTWGLTWHLGIDGISVWLVMLTTFLGPIVILGAWDSVSRRHTEFFFHLLALQTAMLGAFVAQNLAVFYVFWELMLIPMFFLIGIWGGKERLYATLKFVLYTVFGSMLMLVAIFYLYWLHHEQAVAGLLGPAAALSPWSLEFTDLYRVQMGADVQAWLFLAFALAFAVKVPMFPLHTWLPDAHVQAPTAGSVVLAGVLLKMGTYGFLRLGMPLFPAAVAEWAWVILVLAVVGIVYGALVAMIQPDMKKLVAYSSVSHMGYIMLGIFVLNPQGVEGGILQMLNHGISTGALFLLVGVLYDRTHTRRIWDFGGLAKVMPIYTTVFIVVALSSAGLPGTNGFVGEFLTLLGAFQWGHEAFAQTGSFWSSYGYVVVAATGVVLGAVYLLWMIERVFFGPILQSRWLGLKDLSAREGLVFAPLLLMIFWMGLYPKPFIDKMEPTVEAWIEQIRAGEKKAASLPQGFGSPANPSGELHSRLAASGDAQSEGSEGGGD
ncbi:MAG TPA: Fe-S-binding domain-containing protein [Deltaproteobacteria bacterium]|nr:Fe-S-binding domain-containing protein [Deltaproteobacteria bacterium]HCP45386.1 Fe-S-binding domain-containing protein [Deltaproteobacteria bacterium]